MDHLHEHALLIGDEHGHRRVTGTRLLGNPVKERSKVKPGGGRHELGLGLQTPKVIEGLGLNQVALVKDKDPLDGGRLDLRERLFDGRALLVPVGIMGVNHLEHEVGGSDLGKRGLEALDEVGR